MNEVREVERDVRDRERFPTQGEDTVGVLDRGVEA